MIDVNKPSLPDVRVIRDFPQQEARVHRLSDEEIVLAGLFRLRNRAEREGNHATRARIVECIRLLTGRTERIEVTLPGVGR